MTRKRPSFLCWQKAHERTIQLITKVDIDDEEAIEILRGDQLRRPKTPLDSLKELSKGH